MQKPSFFLPVISILIFVFMVQFVSGQEGGSCTPQFTIYSADTFEATAGSSIEIDVAVKNTGACAGSAVVIAEVPEGWNKTKIATGDLGPGEIYRSSIKLTLPEDAKSSIVNLIAPGAEVSPVKIIIGGIVPEENATAEQQVETQPPAANITPVIPLPAQNESVIVIPQENKTTPQPQQTETQPAQSQPASSVTGLLTSNPASQIAVFAIILFGAGYLAARIKSEGFRYRFRKA